MSKRRYICRRSLIDKIHKKAIHSYNNLRLEKLSRKSTINLNINFTQNIRTGLSEQTVKI